MQALSRHLIVLLLAGLTALNSGKTNSIYSEDSGHSEDEEEDFQKKYVKKKTIYLGHDLNTAIAMITHLGNDIADLEGQVDSLMSFKNGIEEQDHCSGNPCENYGTCEERVRGYQCICLGGFSGKNCEDDIGAHDTFTIQVTNGVERGSWFPFEMCPTGSLATAYRLRIEPVHGTDDSGVNVIQLQCTDVKTGTNVATVTSETCVEGDWGEWQTCQNDYYLVQFTMKAQSHTSDDNTGTAGLRMTCRGPGLKGTYTDLMEADSAKAGKWGNESKQCPEGQAICGLATKLLENQGASEDDFAITDVAFKCCYFD